MKKFFRSSGIAAVAACVAFGATACNHDGNSEASGSDSTITVSNCGKDVQFPASAKKILVNDGNITSFPLAVGAQEKITGVSYIDSHLPILKAAYGDEITKKPQIAKEYPSLEEIIAAEPDVYIAGWGYGFGEDTGITPDSLAEHGIAAYTLTESCRQSDEGAQRGITDPWEAVRIDLKNIGAITGHESEASEALADMDRRLKVLADAPKAAKAPKGFVFDSARDAPFTSGSLGAPQGVLERAGAVNATSDIKDTWTTTSWEYVAEQQPDFIALVEYAGATFEEKIQILRTNPATKDLKAVKENRFINLPYAMWTESPLNVDAAEHVRKALEKFQLVPNSDIKPKLQLPKETPGLQYQ